jgi:hypothetical protein
MVALQKKQWLKVENQQKYEEHTKTAVSIGFARDSLRRIHEHLKCSFRVLVARSMYADGE